MILITGITGLTGRFYWVHYVDQVTMGWCGPREQRYILGADDKVDFIYGDVGDACSLLPAFNGWMGYPPGKYTVFSH